MVKFEIIINEICYVDVLLGDLADRGSTPLRSTLYRNMINNEKIEEFLKVMKQLIDFENYPPTKKTEQIVLYQFHDLRHKLWSQMTDIEKEVVRLKLGKDAKWI